MKLAKSISIPFIATATLLLLFLAANAAEPIGDILQFEGPCSITRGGQTITVDSGTPIHLNDKVSTGLQGKMTVLFVDDTRLMLDSLSSATIDEYTFSGNDSNLLFQFSTGSFRAITGEIVKLNPTGFNMQTPLTTLGIRGSDIYALVGIIGEEVGALDLGPGHVLEISTTKQKITISQPGLGSTISPSGIISRPAPIPARIQKQMEQLAQPPTTPRPSSHTITPRVPTASTAPTVVIPTPTQPTSTPRRPHYP